MEGFCELVFHAHKPIKLTLKLSLSLVYWDYNCEELKKGFYFILIFIDLFLRQALCNVGDCGPQSLNFL